jgi:hypothetical protein
LRGGRGAKPACRRPRLDAWRRVTGQDANTARHTGAPHRVRVPNTSEYVKRAEADLIDRMDSPAFAVIEFLVQEIACVVPCVNVNILHSADRIHEF